MGITDDAKKSIVKDEAKKTVVTPSKTETAKVNLVKNPTVKSSMHKGITIKISRPTPTVEKDKHCHNFEVVLSNSNATPIRNHVGIVYTCIFCAARFKYPADLKTHTLRTHDNTEDRRQFMKKLTSKGYLLKLDITLLKCKLCDKSIGTLEGLFEHLRSEHNKVIYTDIKNQIIPFKFGDDELKCAICSGVFTTYKVLLEHMRTHYRNFVCDICDFGCFNRSSMYAHKRKHATDSFESSTCNKVFDTQTNVKVHANAIHKYKSMPAKCAVCNERFRNTRKKDKHMITVHGWTPAIRKCMACDKIFATQSELRKHTTKHHLMERNFKCTECEMKFFASSLLKEHMLKHTGKKDFQCDVCKKWFTRKSVLPLHMRTHMNYG